MICPLSCSSLVATDSLGLLILVVSILGLHLLDERNVLLLGLVSVVVGVLDGLLPGTLLCLALYIREKSVGVPIDRGITAIVDRDETTI